MKAKEMIKLLSSYLGPDPAKDGAKPDGVKPAEGDATKPAEGDAAKPAEGDAAKPAEGDPK